MDERENASTKGRFSQDRNVTESKVRVHRRSFEGHHRELDPTTQPCFVFLRVDVAVLRRERKRAQKNEGGPAFAATVPR